jgi:hypothetical protein
MTTATGYAEMFEWEDGNPNHEDRTGLTVILRNDKVALANGTEIDTHDIIGVVGGDNTSVSIISGASADEWHNKHLRDDFNRLLWEDQVMVEWIDNGYRHWYELDRLPDGMVVPENATYYREWMGHPLRREILSEEYKNPNKIVEHYMPRFERKEWAIVILCGRAKIKASSRTNPAWKRMTPIGSNEICEWLVR